MKEDHTKLFARVDNLVETDKIAIEMAGKTVYNCEEIKDKQLRDREINLLKELEPVKYVYKKLMPRQQNPLDQ